MSNIKTGDIVKVFYTGRMSDGTIFDSNEGKDPFEFSFGVGHVIKGFENAVLGLKPGDKVTVIIPASEAYGERNMADVLTFEKKRLTGGNKVELLQRIRIDRGDGSYSMGTVIEMTADSVVVDCNHTLAGEDLMFDITLLEVVSA